MLTLHGYYRSSAAYRVRIALHLKSLDYAIVSHHLRKGEQKAADYRALNPQGLVPALEMDGAILTQSLAICEYLEEVRPGPPGRLLPAEPLMRARVRAFAQVIACDIHPVQNLKILQRLKGLGIDQAGVDDWARQAIADGFEACETLATRDTPFAFGEEPTLADICLVPQMYNARRFGLELRWPRLLAIEEACMTLPAFRDAAPERQPDAE